MKDYSTYILNENTTAKLKLGSFIANYQNPSTGNMNTAKAEKDLKDMVEGNFCEWRTKGVLSIKKEIITKVMLTKNLYNVINFYFNGFSVDETYNVVVHIENDDIDNNSNNNVELVGIPSGEVLFITKPQSKILIDMKLINFEKWIIWKNIEYKNIYFFKDTNYHEIKRLLDKNYKKPEKKNVEKKVIYKTGNDVVCRGRINTNHVGSISIQDKVGRITSMMKTGNESYYNIKFYVTGNLPKDEFWVPYDNIAGLYTGDIEHQKTLALMQQHQDMEDHEIDDDYHLNQLYSKEKTGIKNPSENSQRFEIGDNVVISSQKSALYQMNQEEFVDVWFKPGHALGVIQDLSIIKGVKCAKTSNTGAWFKISCIKK